jgi:cytochrome c2
MGHKRVQGISLFRLPGMGALVVLLWLSGGLSAAAAPDDLVPAGQHLLTQAQQGDLLIAELRCAACHGAGDERPDAEKAAPNLTLSVRGLSPEYLKKFLADPAAVHPGTTMPNLAGGKTEAERAEIAESLSHFLVSQSTVVNSAGSAESDATGAVSHGGLRCLSWCQRAAG